MRDKEIRATFVYRLIKDNNNRFKIKIMKATELKTITGRVIKVTPNNSNRTFTLRTDGAKYRTIRMNKDEFEDAKYWTGNDWNQFLKTDEYYRVN